MLRLSDYKIETEQARADQKIQDREREGFETFKTGPRVLLLDLDDAEALSIYEARREFVKSLFPFAEKARWTSKSGVGTHVVLELQHPGLAPTERLLLQAVLGSDYKRETLGLRRLQGEIHPFSFLLKPPMTPAPIVEEDVPF